MPSFCAVLNCSDRYRQEENVSFHKFPINQKELLQRWVAFTKRDPQWQPSRWSTICSRHFLARDFKSINQRNTLKKDAVPSVYLPTSEMKPGRTIGDTTSQQLVLPKRSKENFCDGLKKPSRHSSPILPKNNCRLCGTCSPTTSMVTFASNFELYGMIQKCLPTLNIQQDDTLPKEMCRSCLQCLEDFSQFIDKVLQTQSEMERKIRSNAVAEKQLKIKQEPVVRVKQEDIEGFGNLLPDDLDLTVDEICDPETDEQKFQFCDFPMLNSHDIINDCDIMEIINLDDAFINIPDDDGNTTCGNTEDQPGKKQHQPSAHDLLQTHMIVEEHNYSQWSGDPKEEWQLRNFYKTEKTEGYEQHGQHGYASANEHDDEFQHYAAEHHVSPAPFETELKSKELSTDLSQTSDECRSIRPIVTSVSAIAESRLQLPVDNTQTNATTTMSNSLVSAMGETFNTPFPRAATSTRPSTKPNIVVLNESIVKSSAAFQLHACYVCHLKFFSVETLTQHYTMAHNKMPMVSVPLKNILEEFPANAEDTTERAKINSDSKWIGPAAEDVFDNFPDRENRNVVAQTCTPYEQCTNTMQVKRQTQQKIGGESSSSLDIVSTANTPSLTTTCSNLHVLETEASLPHNTMASYQSSKLPVNSLSETSQLCSATAAAPVVKEEGTDSCSLILSSIDLTSRHDEEGVATNSRVLKKITDNFKQLRNLCAELQQRCTVLEGCVDTNGVTKKLGKQFPNKTLKCRICKRRFARINQLLRHKQCKRHFQRKPVHFTANCVGCEKVFRSKLALQNHMNYICQMLSLRWRRNQMKTFRCRECRCITFTHWRLYRRHELRCKSKMRMQSLSSATRCNKVTTKAAEKYMGNIKKALGRNPGQRQHQQALQPKQLQQQQQQQQSPQQKYPRSPKQYPKCSLHSPSKYSHRQRLAPEGKQAATDAAEMPLITCRICHKQFWTLGSYNQHSITHSDERLHKCKICQRAFKRRNGLMQHVKSFHMNIRPFMCPVCQHAYALKSDMVRCRHSGLRYRKGQSVDVVSASTAVVEGLRR